MLQGCHVNSFFPPTDRLWNSLPIECFPLTYDLSGFNSRINRHLLTVGSFFLCRFFLKKLHRKKQSPNFLRGSFSNADNARAPIQFRGEDQPQHLKKFFLKSRPIHFHINRTIVIRSVKQNQASFPSTETNKPLLTPIQCLVHQIQVQKQIQVVATDQMPDHT